MNKLEAKLGLAEQTPIERLFNDPRAYNLKFVPKISQTYHMLLYVCKEDGLALRYASRKLITTELCEIAVNQNGCALEYIPDRLIKENGWEWYRKMCKLAVKSNGRALRYLPTDLIDDEIINSAVIEGNAVYNEDHEWYKYPIAYVPEKYLSAELIKKAVERFPFCIKNIPENRINKALCIIAVKGNGLALKYVPESLIDMDIISAAVSDDAMAIRYVPVDLQSKELCEECFNRNTAVFPYLSSKFISDKMCLKAIADEFFSIRDLSDSKKTEKYGTSNVELILFSDVPEKFRNNKDILRAVIDIYDGNILPLIRWHESVAENWKTYRMHDCNRREEEIKPLKKATIKYLLSNFNKPEEKPIQDPLANHPAVLNISANAIYSLKNTVLPLQQDLPSIYTLVKSDPSELIEHDFSEDDTAIRTIHYITDIHVEHQLINELDKMRGSSKEKLLERITELISVKISEMVSDIEDHRDILLIGGDVADSVGLSELFYHELYKQWCGGLIISVLGNHELWDGTTMNEWLDPNFTSRPIEEIVDDYKTAIMRGGSYNPNGRDAWQREEHCVNSIVLENDLYVIFKDRVSTIISEEDIINASNEDLKGLLSKCTFMVLGGIGYSGLNPVYNFEQGLYRKALKSAEEDKLRSKRFRKIYKKIKECAEDRKIIVLTHTQVEDWLKKPAHNNWIHVNGHTHQEALTVLPDGTTILSDNQVGYEPKKWKLNSFTMSSSWYDPFEQYNDGMYEINSDEYREFNRGRGISNDGCSYPGKLYMLKRSKMYMFLLKSNKSLCLLNGGQRKRLENDDVQFYYDNLQRYSDNIRRMIKPYQSIMQQLSEEVKRIGGTGRIHGCIVDISYFSHIYVNPYDGKITPYWALNISSRITYKNVKRLIKSEEPDLLESFLNEDRKKSIPLIGESKEEDKTELVNLPQWIFGTEMYQPSRIMKAIQYVWEQNVIRIWNDDVLRIESTDTCKELHDVSKERTLPGK